MCDRDRLISENLGLVHSCAGRFRGRGIEYDDLFQTGCIGLIKAAERFRPSLGYKFSTYAVPVILGEIKREFRDTGAVKVSRGLKELGLKIFQVREKFVRENGREPSVCEISDILGRSEEEVAEAVCAGSPVVSLELEEDGEERQMDIPVCSGDGKLIELMALRSELMKLEENDRRLMILRFFMSKTQAAAAKILGMTQVQVSRRERRILSGLRSRLI